MERVRLDYMHLAPGQPLPFELTDAHGRVLLKHGYVIRDEAQIERLVERGVYFEAPEDAASQQQPADETRPPQVCGSELFDAYVCLVDSTPPDCAGVADIAGSLQAFCETHADMALACTLLQRAGCYSLRHSFHTAILSEMLLKRLGRPAEERCQAIAGALTMNLCMRALQDELYAQNIPLTIEQKRTMIAHPQSAAQMLREQGIADPVWLEVVENHHEMVDGSGYAKRLLKTSLGIGSQAVSLADRFCALVSARGYRAGIPPSVAIKNLLERQSATIDPLLSAAFVKEIGLYPPGTLVLLASGEVGLVVRRLLNPAHPLVRALRAVSGVRFDVPPKRITSKPAHAIKEALDTDAVKKFDIEVLWQAMSMDESDTDEAGAVA